MSGGTDGYIAGNTTLKTNDPKKKFVYIEYMPQTVSNLVYVK